MFLSQIPHQRPPSGKDRPAPVKAAFGRKQFESKNMASGNSAKVQMGNYSQSYGTINASSLAAINSSKKW